MALNRLPRVRRPGKNIYVAAWVKVLASATCAPISCARVVSVTNDVAVVDVMKLTAEGWETKPSVQVAVSQCINITGMQRPARSLGAKP